MKITIVGAGNIGRTLGAKWAQAGHAVVFGVRDPQSASAQLAVAAGSGVTVDTFKGAISFGEIVVLAVPASAVEAIVTSQANILDGKVIIDATNKVGAAEMNSIRLLAEQAPQAHLFRAFNSLGWENFAEPQIGGTQVDLFFCGADGVYRQDVERLITDIGLRPIYVGGLEQVPIVDNLARLWFALALGRQMGRHLAFRLLSPEST
jgi:8-hydroxy-5-deazaflavin:NADPH oxidoreductase